MEEHKPWYEKMGIWIAIIAGVFTILGFRVFDDISFIKGDVTAAVDSEDNEQNTVDTKSGYTQPEEKEEVSQAESNDLSNETKQSIDETNKEMTSQYECQNEDDKLENEDTNIQGNLTELKDKIEALEGEIDRLQSESEQHKDEINELQSGNEQYKDEINKLQSENERYKDEMNKLQTELNNYRIRYGEISIDNYETVSIFTLDTFQGSELWYNKENTSDLKSFFEGNFIDTYGIEYPHANLAKHYFRNTMENNSTTYLLDYNYTKCEGKIAWPKCDKNEKGNAWIEFYSDDELIYSTEPISASNRALHFEFNVEDLEKLTVVKKAKEETSIIYIIYPYFNLVK